MKLNGWQRVGVVLSVLWVIGAASITRRNDIDRAGKAAGLAYHLCVDTPTFREKLYFSVCNKDSQRAWDVSLEGSWPGVVFVSLAPIPIFWGFAYLLLGVWRWIRRGFETHETLESGAARG